MTSVQWEVKEEVGGRGGGGREEVRKGGGGWHERERAGQSYGTVGGRDYSWGTGLVCLLRCLRSTHQQVSPMTTPPSLTCPLNKPGGPLDISFLSP